MKLTRKVKRITVKKCFVASQYIRKHRSSKKRFLPKLAREEFLEKLKDAKEYVDNMQEENLDERIKNEDPKRLRQYNSLNWYEGNASPQEISVWKRAGGLPLAWTNKNLLKTAKLVKKSLEVNNRILSARSKRAIPRMMGFLDLIENEKYLYPIIVRDNARGRKYLKKYKGSLDDGNMRAIALTISGRKNIKAFIGVSNNTNQV